MQFDPISTPHWQALKSLASEIRQIPVAHLFEEDKDRIARLTIDTGPLHLDLSKNLIDDRVLQHLLALAEASPLRQRTEAMFNGEIINTTEKRAVLHTALRDSPENLRQRGLTACAEAIEQQLSRAGDISEKIRTGKWLGVTGKPITHIVNLGIGGSDLGPKMVCEALKEYACNQLTIDFVSNVDGEVIHTLLKKLNPETTLILVASKTFTTQETLLNANTAAKWLKQHLQLDNPFASPHFMGITAAVDKAISLGIPRNQILEIWDWVGGRYSLWSAIGLPIAIAIGIDGFRQLLAGARDMDNHFRSASWRSNMPVMLALLGFWYNTVMGAESQAIIPYCERLRYLPFYLQQLDMESNGKGVTLSGLPVKRSTGPIIWGATGTDGQHSFFQLIHQGTHLIPVDFIALMKDGMSKPEHHKVLLANMLAQAAGLMQGNQSDELPPYRRFDGNRPSSILMLEVLTPHALGSLIALYEHKVFVQSCLWNINAFDQWGVELGKNLTKQLLDTDHHSLEHFDPSTEFWLDKSLLS